MNVNDIDLLVEHEHGGIMQERLVKKVAGSGTEKGDPVGAAFISPDQTVGDFRARSSNGMTFLNMYHAV